MDLRNLCSKLDVDAIRAKIPPLPQIKLPKSMSKLRSRKIFRSSRENVNANSRRGSSKRIPANSENLPLPLGPPFTIPPSEFINRTPTRISTVSSLMNQNSEDREGSRKWKSKTGNDESFYRSAGGIEDYYPSPLNQRFEHLSRPISPVRAPAVSQEFRAQSDLNVKMSIGERLQKGYKDVTEFKLKHLFAKKTVVRTDQIEITEYIHRFDKDRKRDERVQEKLDRDIADNYRFQFKISKQNSEESYLESPDSSPQANEPKKKTKTLSELSGDESGMELSPPPRKPGIASTRFSRVRHTPLNMSLEEDNDDNDSIHVVEEIESNIKASRRSSKKSKNSIDSDKSFGARQTSRNMSFDEDDDDNDDGIKLDVVDENSPKIKHNTSSLYDIKKQKSPATFEKKGKAPLTPQQSEENNADSLAAPTKSDKPFDAIKHNFKRLQKSIKLPQQMHLGAESENDEANPESNTKQSKTQQFTERLRRFRSTDHVNKNSEDGEDNLAPIHKFTHKIQEWKKSIKKQVDTQNTDNDDDYRTSSPQKQDKPVGSLMKKLKHIRSRKRDSIEDPDDDEEGGETYKESLAARAKLQLEKGKVVACQMPEITRKKISETKKYFKKKQETEVKQNPDKPKTDEEDLDDDRKVTVSQPAIKSIPRPPPPIPRPYFHNSSEEEDSDDQDRFITKSIAESKLIAVPPGRAVWTTKPILSEDATDYDDELPRVLLHQDNSDVFESTLIIAVTRPISRNTTPIITELPPDFTEEESKRDTKPDNWIPNQDVLSTFLDMTPPTHRKLSKDSNDTFNLRAHSRKLSIDSSSEDSWIKDIPKGPSTAVLNSVYENEIPWKIQKGNSEDHLYKTKSIDLFEMQKKHGGALTAFEDFDYELKNTPVVKIETEETKYVERDERESSEELDNPDDDNSSRVTKISVRPQEIKNSESEKFKQKLKSQAYGNSQESLTGNLDDKDIIDSGEEDDNEESDEYDENENEFHEPEDVDIDRPPSKAPSPPPSISQPPPPPPLPERKPSLRLSKLDISPLDLACPSEPPPPPPLPLTKPPVPPNRPTPPPPKIPERNPPTTRTSKPLVKTASLRLAYSEQVKPQDVGKVNKLISRFEPDGPKQRPRIVPRKPITSESEEYSDEEDSFELLPTVNERDNTRDTTPTNHARLQKSFSIDSVDLTYNNDKLSPPNQKIYTPPTRKATSQILFDNSDSAIPIPSISISPSCLDINSNFSQPSSVYGSPLAYPSSLIGSTEATPLTNRKDPEHLSTTRRNRRSMARDDEHFYSFDSDEENSYYSISSTSSNRYVVEL